FRQWQRKDPSDALFSIAFLAIDVMAAFTQMLASGMFERYPRLKCAVLEAGSNWIAAWLDRLPPKWRGVAHPTASQISARRPRAGPDPARRALAPARPKAARDAALDAEQDGPEPLLLPPVPDLGGL